MTLSDTATSLRHWIIDQIRLTPHAVLDTTDTFTALDHVLAPGLDIVPACQWEHLEQRRCAHSATMRVKLHTCPDATISAHHLLCDHHTVRLIAAWTAWFARTTNLCCADCGIPFRAIPDVIKQVSNL